jgi:hypothetical protein|tara:strand:+ start:208 stop:411 length:204 start_codon:yes stop_codon:yes gene_type:complete
MEDIIDLIATDSAASEVTDKLKDILFTKSAERIENQRPNISASMFDEPEIEVSNEPEESEVNSQEEE